jgi:hypothetical protein
MLSRHDIASPSMCFAERGEKDVEGEADAYTFSNRVNIRGKPA